MSDDLTPKRPDDITPDSKPPKPKPVHPLLRRPAQPEAGSGAQPPRRAMRVEFSFTRPRRSLITWGLILVNVLIFAITALFPGLTNDVVANFANQPDAVLNSAQYWRLFTSMFLHAGIVHLLINMLALQSLGAIMEVTFGHTRYLLVYLLGGLGGSILSAALNEPMIYSVGASGAVFALFGAEAAHLYTNWRVLERFGPGARMRLRQVIMLATLNFLVGFIGNIDGGGLFNIDNWAHIGGFAAGALLAYLIGPKYKLTLAESKGLAQLDDTRPFKDHMPTAIYFAAGLIGALLVAILVR